ncbi:MAG: hypothetical protein LC624_08830 [Halobacteriales archaeon]|nr:hypothetical protein [Halobacteriales archaeon]
MAGFDILGFSPLLVLLVILAALIFLKMMKWIVLIAIIAAVYLALKLGMVPGVTL